MIITELLLETWYKKVDSQPTIAVIMIRPTTFHKVKFFFKYLAKQYNMINHYTRNSLSVIMCNY